MPRRGDAAFLPRRIPISNARVNAPAPDHSGLPERAEQEVLLLHREDTKIRKLFQPGVNLK